MVCVCESEVVDVPTDITVVRVSLSLCVCFKFSRDISLIEVRHEGAHLILFFKRQNVSCRKPVPLSVSIHTHSYTLLAAIMANGSSLEQKS